jgi:two-component system, sensor histidine kinase and response regulator
MDMFAGLAPRILIVDDDPALLEALPETVRLRIPHASVETADSAGAALECVATADPDVIVTDLVMPGMTGIDLILKIRQVRPWTPMILMSGNPSPQGYALRTRAYAFIHKPIDREFFIASLRRAIRYSRLSKRIQGTTEHVKQHLDQLAELQRRAAEHAATVRSHYAGGPSITSVSERVASTSSHRS